jgi:hypothetical protein
MGNHCLINTFSIKSPEKIILGLFLLAALIISGCKPPPPAPPPVITYPSRIVSEEGTTFLINGLQLPGTFQELQLRRGTATLWVDPAQIQTIRFYGPEHNRYRWAEIIFIDGHRLKAEIFVDVLLEGTSEGVYWNMPLSRVQLLQFGTQ